MWDRCEMTKLSTAPGGTNLNLNISFGMSAFIVYAEMGWATVIE